MLVDNSLSYFSYVSQHVSNTYHFAVILYKDKTEDMSIYRFQGRHAVYSRHLETVLMTCRNFYFSTK